MQEIYYQAALIIGSALTGLIITGSTIRYTEIKLKLQQLEKVISTINDALEDDDEVTPEEAKRVIKAVLALVS